MGAERPKRRAKCELTHLVKVYTMAHVAEERECVGRSERSANQDEALAQ